MDERALANSEARIFGIVTRLLANRTRVARLDADQPLYDAGLSSLDMVNLMLAVEAEFDVEIPQEHIAPENFRSVAAIDRLISSLAPTP
ncbi:phosphopantetheine-binding protein [Phenylobacterium sp. LjRoot225]|uniref:phosphopantetheine-binding protein n=1 Tax=Phenylobacterium sp. LjRoot225 TaxID=3342285 RepID=UPI003ED07513